MCTNKFKNKLFQRKIRKKKSLATVIVLHAKRQFLKNSIEEP